MKKSEFKVLVAEDDAMVSEVIAKFLSEEGYSVVSANDGLEAIRLLRLEEIKLVLTDLRMPGADGMEVLRTAVQIDPKIPVVLITAYGTLDVALEAMKEGAYYYIVKPFVMQQLLLVARNAYRMANLMEENENLSNQLKEMYRHTDGVRAGSGSDETAAYSSTERIRKLQELRIINADEAGVLLKRMNAESESGNKTEDTNINLNENRRIREYDNLIKGLKTDSDVQLRKLKNENK
ncbi:MAG: response regulator [Nitrospirota bacterium]|nr:response regulator [Nitrospirota bacterium]